MKTIGITGGIGSGKTVVSHVLETLSYPVYNADRQAKCLMNTSYPLIRSLKEILGEEIYKEGRLDRGHMAQLIFSDPGLLHRVNALVHPAVKEDFLRWCRQQKNTLLFLESAILFESGLGNSVDRVWVVSAPEPIRIARVMDRDRLSEEQIKARLAAQMKEEEKISLGDLTLINDGITPLLPQIIQAVAKETETDE